MAPEDAPEFFPAGGFPSCWRTHLPVQREGWAIIRPEVYQYWIDRYDWPVHGPCLYCRGETNAEVLGFLQCWLLLTFIIAVIINFARGRKPSNHAGPACSKN